MEALLEKMGTVAKKTTVPILAFENKNRINDVT